MLGIPVLRTSMIETTGLGAAILGLFSIHALMTCSTFREMISQAMSDDAFNARCTHTSS